MNETIDTPQGSTEPTRDVENVSSSESTMRSATRLNTGPLPVVDPLDRDVDDGVTNYFQARAKIESESQTSPYTKAAARLMNLDRMTPKKVRHHSRRGGRAYPEPSDSELEGYPQMSRPVPTTPEQDKVNDEGIALFKAMGKFMRSEEYLVLSDEDRVVARSIFIKGFKSRYDDDE